MKYLCRCLLPIALALALSIPLQAEEQPAPAAAAEAPAAKPEKPKTRQFTGEITALDVDAKTVSVKNRQNDTKEFVCDPSCKISTADKKVADLTDLKVGDRTTVHYREEDGKNICVKMVPPPPPKAKAEGKQD